MRAVVFAYSNVGDRCLRVLRAAGVEIPLVITHRDRADEVLWFARVADTAGELGLACCCVEDLATGALPGRVAAARPDILFSFYFREVLQDAVLELAPRGAFNLHGSLLPRYRGRAPTNWAVLRGETETGATLHYMVTKADAGDIVDQLAVPILPDDTGRQVFDKVSVAAETVLWRSLPALIAGTAPRMPNDLSRGSYFGARTPDDGRIDFSWPAQRVYDLIRALAPPYPGAFTKIGERRLVIVAARLARREESLPLPPVLGLQVVGKRIVARCGDGGQILIHGIATASGPLEPPAVKALLESSSPPESP